LFHFMQEHIFQPLQMNATMNLDTIPEGSTALATGYMQTALASLRPAPYEGPGWSFGSGQVVTTAHDVALWDAAFLRNRVLPAKQAAEEITPARLADGTIYPSALGLFVSREDSPLRYYHVGQGLGFETENLIYPQLHMAFVVLTNTSAKATMLRIADRLTYLLVPPNQDEALARKVFSGLQHGRPDSADFSPDLDKYMTAAMLAQYRSSLAPLGPVQSFTAAKASRTDGLETRNYDVTAGGRALLLHLLLLPDGRLEDATITAADAN
jgi:D-alanyl-D-alanine carboxypeptidase